MAMSDKKIESCTVRFKPHELERRERFVSQNHFFDFSTLARISIQRFIEDPILEVRGLKPAPAKEPAPAKGRRKKSELSL